MRLIASLLLLLSLTSNASQQVIVIPTDDTYQIIPFSTSSAPKVFFIDDVADSNRSDLPYPELDPNGVQELAILIGWKNLGYIDLVGIGVDSDDNKSLDVNFVQNLLSLSGEALVAKTGTDLEIEIIQQANALIGTGEKLSVVVGGPWNVVEDAIDRSNCITPNTATTPIPNCSPTPIQDLIKVIGIGGSNVVQTNGNPSNEGNRTDARDSIFSYLAAEDRVQLEPTQFTRFLNPNNGFINYLAGSSWYEDTYHPTKIGDYLLQNDFDRQNIRANYCNFGTVNNETQWFCNNAIDGSPMWDSNNNCNTSVYGASQAPYPPNVCIPSLERYPFRGADFTAIAFVIWGESAFSMTTEMYTEIENALSTLPLK